MRPLLPGVVLTLLAGLAPACAYETVVTAARVPVPVLVGPVQRIGAAPTQAPKAKAFDVKVDHTYLVSSSSNGYTTTTTTTHVREGTGKVDAALRKATDGDLGRAVHVDEVRVRAFSGFAMSTAWISSRVRIKGSVGETLTPMAEDGITTRPEPEETEESEESEESDALDGYDELDTADPLDAEQDELADAEPAPEIQKVPESDGLIEPFAYVPAGGAR